MKRAILRSLPCWTFVFTAMASAVIADTVTLKNNMQYSGNVGKIGSLGEDPLNPRGPVGQVKVKQIVFVDDDLRRTFFSSIQVDSVTPEQIRLERIQVNQRVAKGNKRVAIVGPILKVSPFDKWGRRIFTMNTKEGPLDIIQGITEVTPTYTKVEGLLANRGSYIWDMRLATSAIPRSTITTILSNQIKQDDPDDRLRLVRLYMQAERYRDAQLELDAAIKDFPELANLKKQSKQLQQMRANRMVKEIELRKGAGQHRLAYNMLDHFPDQGVAGEILLKVRDTIDEYKGVHKQGREAFELLKKHLAEIKDPQTRAEAEPAVNEIISEIRVNTFDRLADYLRLASDDKMTADQKVSLAISGWLLGSNSGTENLAVATSLYDVRQIIVKYLNSERLFERQQALDELKGLEGSTPAYVAKLLSHMKPAQKTAVPQPAADEDPLPPGLFELKVAGLSGDITYYVQLPPEYDPYKQYPCIVTLNGAGTTPKHQIDWWAGVYNEKAKLRLGQAARQGYIVVAPAWSKPHQVKYEFTAREHAAVLFSLRDACRRFAIDTDRTFLSGHSMGGDATWDIALAHPDLWAGVIPVVATTGKYISRYWENGRYVPMYFVSGELDGTKRSKNSMDLDRYMTKSKYDVVAVEYRGRGHEHFQDEIQRLFEWMKWHKREFFNKDFTVYSMRPWDNYFWWAEMEGFPQRNMVVPANWPPKNGIKPSRIEGKILENNRITLKTGGAQKATVWLSPEMVDFSKRVFVSINGRRNKNPVKPSVEVMLEDVRTRGDRQHPFWAKAEL